MTMSEYEDMAFEKNLREFANRVSLICGLENGGKLSTHDAFKEIKALWKELKRSKKGLRIGEPPGTERPSDNAD
jgi:hypothetical protein